MAADGNWNITMTTPMGERNAALSLKSSGGALTGTQSADGNSGEIFDGTVNGDDVAWKISITNPMPLTLAFTGKVEGDAHLGRNGHRPDGEFPVQGREGLRDRERSGRGTSVFLTLPWRGRVGEHRAKQDARRGGVTPVNIHPTPPLISFAATLPLQGRVKNPHPRFNSLKKSLPLSSMMIKAGKS